jgi:hypothetical protein
MGFESYNAYLTYNTLISSSPVEYFQGHLQAIADSVFEISSNIYTVKHRTKLTDEYSSSHEQWTDIRARLVVPFEIKQLSMIKDDFFHIIFKDFNYQVYLGDVFEFQNYRWLVINTSKISSITNSVLVQRCNAKLRFTTSTPLNTNIIEVDGCANKYIMRGLKEEQFIILPENKLNVQIPNDINGRKIKYTDRGGTRFLLGNPFQNWKTTSFDNITMNRTTNNNLASENSGIIKLQLELSEINTGMDDLVNGIAWQEYF